MGTFFSYFFRDHEALEGFMISYMQRRGPTPYNMELLPGGPIQKSDNIYEIRHKFRVGLKYQQELDKAVKMIRGKVRNCLSPVLTRSSLSEEDDEQVEVVMMKKPTRLRLGRPLSCPHCGSEELIECVLVKKKQQQAKSRKPPKKSRSRPVKSERQGSGAECQRHARSVMEVSQRELQNRYAQGEPEMIEKISLEGRKKNRKCWPSKKAVWNVTKNPEKCPTSYFLGRFRKNSSSPYFEVDYRVHSGSQEDEREYFKCSGQIENLLEAEACINYQQDKLNNNVDLKEVFLQNVAYFFNCFEGRVWWNGYLFTIEGPVERRIPIISFQMSPPSLTFDLVNLEQVSASRSMNQMSIKGRNGMELSKATPSSSFIIKGKSENDIKQINLSHTKGSMELGVSLPLLSGISSTSPSKVRFAQSTKSTVKLEKDKNID